MSSRTVGCFPHTGHSGSFGTFSSWKVIRMASYTSSLPTSVSPAPRISLMVSVAWMVPMTPGRTPKTPASAQDGTRPGGGGSG